MALIIIIALIILLILYLILKPYFIKYDTTLLFTGGLGTGKTLNAVKTSLKIYKKNLFSIKKDNFFIKIKNKIRYKHNRKVDHKITQHKKHTGKYWQLEKLHELPRLITNIPVRIKKGRHETWSNVLEKEMLTMALDKDKNLIKKIPEYSVVLIDEFPQIVNQYNWNLPDVQGAMFEMATFYRHYISGKLVLTGQSDDEIVKQVRDKMNTFYWLTNFRKFLFFFYKCDICQFINSGVVQNVNLGFVEDNTKTIYGTLFTKHYDSRCYSERYTEHKETPLKKWTKFKTNKIIRFNRYDSPLDKQPKETK